MCFSFHFRSPLNQVTPSGVAQWSLLFSRTPSFVVTTTTWLASIKSALISSEMLMMQVVREGKL